MSKHDMFPRIDQHRRPAARTCCLLLLLFSSAAAQGSDPVCSSDFERLPMTAGIISGQDSSSDWQQAMQALLEIQNEVTRSLAGAHGEWLTSARRNAVAALEEKTIPIQRTLLRDRVILYRYALDIASSSRERSDAVRELRNAQQDYCSRYPQ